MVVPKLLATLGADGGAVSKLMGATVATVPALPALSVQSATVSVMLPAAGSVGALRVAV